MNFLLLNILVRFPLNLHKIEYINKNLRNKTYSLYTICSVRHQCSFITVESNEYKLTTIINTLILSNHIVGITEAES